MGEKLKLNERNYNIRLSHDQDKGEWTASWGQRWSASGGSGPTALRRLADLLESDRRFGAADELLQQYLMKPDVLCKYCHAPIFFAVLTSGKYLAFDVEPLDGSTYLDAEGASMDRCAHFPRTVYTNRGKKPEAAFCFDPRKGPVYVPHPVTCGDSVTEPGHQALKARWVANRIVSDEHRRRVIAGLRQFKADIEHGELDDPIESESHLS